jgi:hypothetical protein
MAKKPYGRTSAAMAKAPRGCSIQVSAIPGLFEEGSKKLRPEIRTLIEVALAKKANGD